MNSAGKGEDMASMRAAVRGVMGGLVTAALAAAMPGAVAGAQTPTPTPTMTPTSTPTPVNTILDFHQMAPVTAPFVGTANPIRGVPGGGLPWSLVHADGTLRSDGSLSINVFGLVLANDPSVPANMRNMNPGASFVGIVSCQSVNASGAPAVVNVTTPPATATPAGIAQITATVQLPTPCLAPVVFVGGTNGAWFAVSGR